MDLPQTFKQFWVQDPNPLVFYQDLQGRGVQLGQHSPLIPQSLPGPIDAILHVFQETPWATQTLSHLILVGIKFDVQQVDQVRKFR